MMVLSLFIIDLMGLFFYTKIGSIRSIGDLPTTNIIEPFIIVLCYFQLLSEISPLFSQISFPLSH